MIQTYDVETQFIVAFLSVISSIIFAFLLSSQSQKNILSILI